MYYTYRLKKKKKKKKVFLFCGIEQAACITTSTTTMRSFSFNKCLYTADRQIDRQIYFSYTNLILLFIYYVFVCMDIISPLSQNYPLSYLCAYIYLYRQTKRMCNIIHRVPKILQDTILHIYIQLLYNFVQYISTKYFLYSQVNVIYKITREYYMPSTSYERRKHNRKGWIFRGVGGTKLCQECAISERTKRVLRLQSYEHLFICMLIYTKIRRGLLFRFQNSALSSLCIYVCSIFNVHRILC